ncbi:MAG: M48 family metalloprotease [Actinomycetota bacterium]|nr:M48 family metalloprotease [Actinomycetota bacterium]
MLVVYVPLVCALALAAGAPQIARRASPRPGSATLVAVALAVALAADIALAVLAGARLLDVAPLAKLLHWRAERPGSIPVPTAISIAAGVALAFVAVAAWIDWRRSRDASRWLRSLRDHGSAGELIVVRSPELLAHAVPGVGKAPDRILISDSMLRALDGAERRVLLEHERSHLRHHHDRYRALSRFAARINPLLRPTIQVTDFLLERWADEDAARAVGSRQLAAHALARAALAGAPRPNQPALAGFAAQRVTSRVTALMSGTPPKRDRLPLLLPATLAMIAALTAVLATHDLAHLFDLLRGDG